MDSGDRVTLEELDRDECLRLLASAPVGRIGVTIGGMPAILPVNFALVGSHIVVRTVPGTKLDVAMRRAVVAFEVDSYAPDGSAGWSVLVRGLRVAALVVVGARAGGNGSPPSTPARHQHALRPGPAAARPTTGG